MSLFLDALAVYDDQIMVVSVVGPETYIKSFRAVLHGEGKGALIQVGGPVELRGGEGYQSVYNLRVYDQGYETGSIHRIGLNSWHLIGVSRYPGLMTFAGDKALWRELKSPRYTTPVLRPWVPWIGRALQKTNPKLLVKTACWQCQAGILRATSEEMDEVVKAGIRAGKLPFTKNDSEEEV